MFRMQIIALVCVGMLLPHAVMGATPAPKVQITDVALQNGGLLNGQIVDQQGIGKVAAQVVVLQQGRKPVQTVTDKTGKFQVVGLSGGTTQLLTNNGQGVYRLWTAKAAPPTAKANALLVSNGQVVRGQACGPCRPAWQGWILPACAAGGIIAGVAVATSNTSTSSP
jgi:hypothetical protein